MANWARAQLLAFSGLLALSLVSWPVQAGSQEAPEITDADGDPELLGVIPVGLVPIISPGVDLLAGWVDADTDTDIVLAMELGAPVTDLSPFLGYEFVFTLVSNGTSYTASAVWDGAFTVGGVATAVVADGAVVRWTIPRTAIDAFRGDVISGMFITSAGSLVTPDLFSALDRAPDEGFGTTYTVTGGFARGGSPTDVDADGLEDAWETEHFGGIEAQNGTGDPDGEGLNNTGEQAAGTDPNNPDTDGDKLSDAQDPFPLDPNRPTDFDGDGLQDAWERKHFISIDAQNGAGDPDKDGLNNTREQALGTDPNKADTDGDGVEDGDDSAPLDPNSGSGDESGTREAEPELYAGAAMFATAATFILLGLAKGL